MSFSEVRNYQYGDDVRNIDWNVTARYDEPFIKIFEEERELTVMVIIDVSASSSFGSQTQSKHEIQTEIAAVLAFSAIQNNDKVGAIFFSDRVEKYIPPKKGKKHILRIIREAIDLNAESKSTNISDAIQYLNNVLKKKSIAFILSDFISPQYADALKIASRRHDIIGVHLFDPREQTLPKVGFVNVQDPETGKIAHIDTSSKSVRQAHSAAFDKNQSNFENTFKRIGLGTIQIDITKDYVSELLKFFKRR